jgi:hypothetical protein
LLSNQEQKYKTKLENNLTGPCGESRVLKLKHLFLFSLKENGHKDVPFVAGHASLYKWLH